MDKLKDQLKPVIKHSFWIACCAIVITTLATWYVNTSRFNKETGDRVAAIKTKFDQGATLMNKRDHPNTDSHKAMDVLIDEARARVFEAWKFQFDHQRQILLWPNDLGDDFIKQATPLFPPESIPVDQQALTLTQRNHYQYYIKTELPKLAALINAPWNPKVDEMADRDTAAPKSRKQRYIVDWSAANQTQLQNTRFDWRGEKDRAPSTQQILYAQEDLWILNQLMLIIRKTNGDVDTRFKAAIKRIDAIMLGQEALTGVSSGGAGGAGGPGGMMMGAGGPGGGANMDASSMMGNVQSGGEGGPNTAAGGGSKKSNDPAHNRYVNTKFEPIAAEKLRGVMVNKQTSAEDAELVVAKRMPVRLKMVMDQRRLTTFLSNCGNAELPVEIREIVSILPAKGGAPATGSGGGGAGGGMGGGGGGEPGMSGAPISGAASMDMGGGGGMEGGGGGMGTGGMEGGGGGMGAGGGGGGGQSGAAFKSTDILATDVLVELKGVVYIYNPVDMDRLGMKPEPAGAETGTKPADGNQNATGNKTESADTAPSNAVPNAALNAAQDAPPKEEAAPNENAGAGDAGGAGDVGDAGGGAGGASEEEKNEEKEK